MFAVFAMFAAMRMMANEQLIQQAFAILQGQEPAIEGWLWIKNVWMPDSPFNASLPNLQSLQMFPRRGRTISSIFPKSTRSVKSCIRMIPHRQASICV